MNQKNLKADTLERLGRTAEADKYRSRVAVSSVVLDPLVSPAPTTQLPTDANHVIRTWGSHEDQISE